jgi:O-antigen ligase
MAMSFIFLLNNKKYFRELCRTNSFLALVSFLAVALTSLILNGSPLSRIDEVVNWIAIFISGYIASIMTKDRNTWFLWVLPITLVGAIIIYPGLTGAGWGHLNILSEVRLTTNFEQRANHLGLICGMFAFAASGLALRSTSCERIVLILLASTSAFLLFRTGARASFLGTAIILSGWLIWNLLKTRRTVLLFGIFIGGLCVLALLLHSPLKNNRIISSVTTGLEQDLSFMQRYFTWNVALTNIKQHPIFGLGFDSFSDQYKREKEKYDNDSDYRKKFPYTIPTTNNAHNFFLHFLSETGIAGLATILWFWATIILKGFHGVNKISSLVAGMFSIALIAFQMNMSLYGSQLSTILFAFAGLSSWRVKAESQG